MSALDLARPTARERYAATIAVVVGILVVGLGMLVVRDGTVPAWEVDVFRAINDLPDALYPVLWPFQQLGALAAGPAVALVLLVLHRPRAAVATLLVTGGKLGGERLVKLLVTRERPATSIGPDIETRGDVSIRGASFVSGHAALVAGLAVVVTPLVPRRWRWIPWLLVAVVIVARVYVGAHNPLDVVCGAALGVGIGVAAILLVPRIVTRSRS